MPSQAHVRWSELRVGITVIVAAAVLMLLIFLMTASTGLFYGKMKLRAYFDNAEGLRIGAPVRLQGVDIGNVSSIAFESKRAATPVVVTLKVSTKYKDGLHKDSIATLSTAGVLGETFVDIISASAKGEMAKDGDELKTENAPGLEEVVRASQSTLQNVDVLVKRVDRIVAAIERGEGSIGKLIYDPSAFNKLNSTLTEIQTMVNAINQGKGTVGKLIHEDELYRRANNAVDRLNKIMDEIDAGKGTVGKLVKDPSLYDNANAAVSKTNTLLEHVNQGKGALGKFAKDEEFARKLDNTVTRLSQIADRVEAGEGTVGKLFKDPSLYNNADQMLVESRNLVKAIRENPKKYLTIHLKVF